MRYNYGRRNTAIIAAIDWSSLSSNPSQPIFGRLFLVRTARTFAPEIVAGDNWDNREGKDDCCWKPFIVLVRSGERQSTQMRLGLSAEMVANLVQ